MAASTKASAKTKRTAKKKTPTAQKFKTVQEYIRALPSATKGPVKELRRTIQQV